MTAAKNPIDPEALLTEDAAARLLSLSPRTLQAWRSKKLGPAFIKLGRSVRYRGAILTAWIDKNTRSPETSS